MAFLAFDEPQEYAHEVLPLASAEAGTEVFEYFANRRNCPDRHPIGLGMGSPPIGVVWQLLLSPVGPYPLLIRCESAKIVERIYLL